MFLSFVSGDWIEIYYGYGTAGLDLSGQKQSNKIINKVIKNE